MRRALILLAALPLAACWDDGCANTVISRLASPDGKHVALLFDRNCGATTDFSTQIAVVAADAEVAGKGNVLIADTDHGAAEPAAWGGPWATMRWVDSGHLEVTHDPAARIFTRSDHANGIAISWRTALPPPGETGNRAPWPAIPKPSPCGARWAPPSLT